MQRIHGEGKGASVRKRNDDGETDAGCGNIRLPPWVPGSHGRGSPASPRPSSRTLWIWMARKAAS
ncbi:hypothetical protein F180042I2_38040 [Enterocloster bolteae]